MKNEEHENSKNTLSECFTGNKHDTDKPKVMKLLFSELKGLMKEIKTSNVKYRNLFDFEKSLFKENVRFIEHIKHNTTHTCKGIHPNESLRKNHDDFISRFNKIRNEKHNNNFIIQSLMHSQIYEEDKYEAVKLMQEYYISASNMPLFYILDNSRKAVFTTEMIFAKKEMKILTTLKRINRLRAKSKLNPPITGIEDEENEVNDRKLGCKILANQCKEFVNNNTVNIDGVDTLYFKSVNIIKLEERKERSRVKFVKKHLDIYDMIQSNKSNIRFAIPQLKKNMSAHHTSHLNTLRRILPEINRINNPCGIVEYKNKMKIKNMGPYFRREISNGDMKSKGYITENVTYNVRPDMKRR